MNYKSLYFFVAFLAISFISHAQRGWEGGYNRLGIKAGANYFTILTDDLPIEGKISWTAGFTSRSSFYNDFQFIYGINFFDLNVDMDGREKIALDSPRDVIPYNMIGIQGNFFGSYKIMGHYLSVEAGPVVQINGKLDARQDREYYYLADYDIEAIDIEKITPFSLNLAVGVSGGFETLKFWLQYQHGVNNILGRLQDHNLQEKDPNAPDFKGNMSMIAGGIVVFL